jgi:hypothetical protein
MQRNLKIADLGQPQNSDYFRLNVAIKVTCYLLTSWAHITVSSSLLHVRLAWCCHVEV